MLYIYCLLLCATACATPETAIHNSQTIVEDFGPVWPPPPQKPRIQYMGSLSDSKGIGVKKSWMKGVIDTIFGKEESEDRMLTPYGVFADFQRIYITDPGAFLVHIFDMQRKKYFQLTKTKNDSLESPIGVAVDASGDIYVTDSVLKRVFIFSKEGRYLRELGSTDTFLRPTGITLDEDRIYVTDTLRHAVVVFSKKDGAFFFSFGKNGNGEGEFNYPTNIYTGKDKHLYIIDSMNFRVQIFDRDGKFLSSFGKPGDGSGDFSKPKGIATDSEGHIYITDAHFDTVQIFDTEGNLLLAFGSTGRGKGEMILPSGIFIDRLDKIYVADSYNHRIQVFQYIKEQK
jgi:DNA-binding beta-propeller fold protein YncE